MAHPPWLRFQAYYVGLPKTGSTSVFAMFANYRSKHEHQLMDLVSAGLARGRGEFSDAAFLAALGPRLVPASLEMDAATCHHLYPEVLVERFPAAVFIQAVRDVGSWANSTLDMMLRKKLARRSMELPFSAWELEYQLALTGGDYSMDSSQPEDYLALAHMMRFWADHMQALPKLVPADRLLQLRTRDLAPRVTDIADFVGVPAATMRLDLSHTNRAPMRFDRFSAGLSQQVRDTYLEFCSAPMAQWYPQEHQRWLARCAAGGADSVSLAGRADWADYLGALGDWVADAVVTYGPSASR